MSLDIYRNFMVIVDEGSLTSAAKILHIAQPALTNQIRILEDRFGAELIQTGRGIRQIKVTDAGRVLYEKAKYLCELEDSAVKEINDINRGLSGVLNIGVAPSVSEHVINNLLLDFQRIYKNITVELYELVSGDIGELLLAGVCEIGIIRAPLPYQHLLNSYMIENEVMSAIFRKDSQWIKNPGESLSISDLLGVPICMDRTFRDRMKSAFDEINASANIVSTCVLRQSCVTFAKSGDAVALVSAGTIDEMGDDLYCLPLRGEVHKLKKSLITVKNRGLSAVALNFLKFAGERFGQEWDIQQ
ncbi:MAG: LysR family transcriptional regulator [Deferribacterales bacterium]